MVVLPTLTGVTIPVEPIVATDGVPELHTPPEVPSVRVIVEPLQTVPGPDIAATAGNALTVINFIPKPVQEPLNKV